MSRASTSIASRIRAGWTVAALVLAGVVSFPPADARPIPETDLYNVYETPSGFQIAQRGRISLQEAVRMATQRYDGRVVRASTSDRGGRTVHEIRILLADGNRVVTVRVDADTGEMR